MQPRTLYRLESGVAFIACVARWADVVRVGLRRWQPPGAEALTCWHAAARARGCLAPPAPCTSCPPALGTGEAVDPRAPVPTIGFSQ